MGDERWYRRGDGAEFAVPAGSDAETNLIRLGATPIDGPDGAKIASADDAPPDPLAGTKRELLEYAGAEGLEVDVTMDDKRDDIVAAVKAALAARDSAGSGT